MKVNQDQFIAKQIRRRKRGKVIPPVVDASRLWRPFPITTPYRATGNPAWSLGYHTGEDHACPDGSRATSVSWGRVVCVANWVRPGVIGDLGPVAHWGDAYGSHVIVRTGSGLWDVAWCHLSKTFVGPGDLVRPGQVLGLTGHTGGSGRFGPHLHLEARHAGGRFGTDVDPLRVKRMGRG